MKIVCQLSGGADSALALIKTRERWPDAEVHTLFIDYNQVCREQEYRAALSISKKLGIEELHCLRLPNLWKSGGMIEGEYASEADVYTPLRNLVLLGMSLAYAESIGADTVVTGSKGHSKVEADPHSYYDSTLAFHTLMEMVWFYTTEKKRNVHIVPILSQGHKNTLSKEEVYSQLIQNGIKYEDTWSCFRGGEYECGECINCIVKRRCYETKNNAG
jgi:7-cyano-7-deazaguanine synthase